MLLLKTKLVYAVLGALLLWVGIGADQAWACAVCGGGPLDATSDVFVVSTLVLSVVPLAAMGGLVYLLVRSYRKQQSL